MIHTLIISPEIPPAVSGVGDHAFYLARALAEREQRVDVITSQNQHAESCQREGVSIHPLCRTWDSDERELILQKIIELNPDILHIQYQTYSFLRNPMINFLPWAIRARKIPVKIVTTFHEFASPYKNLTLIPFFLGNHANVLTNDRDWDRFRSLLPSFIQKKNNYIPLAANIERQPEDEARIRGIRESLGVPKSSCLMVRFGFLHSAAAEQLKVVIPALENLKEEGCDFMMILIGQEDAAAKSDFLEFVREHQLTKHIKLLGEMDPEDISYHLQASDMGIAPYPDGISERRTGFLALIAHRLPVITTRGRHSPQNLVEGRHLLFVSNQRDSNDWTAKLKQMMENRPLREEIRENLKEIASYYSWNKIGQLTQELYQRLLGECVDK